ncbi:TadE/TadG family type IV pilus assembly protein [Loktanella sp. R86503]|uniref:TadE/TadG family type IV pilus assembly protein n=1 Tax=Loktanella sp. R86503 TaxID=3093847 RepID=UPI0036DA755B
MTMTTRLRLALHRLWRQEDGTLTIEFLILAPIMFWTFLATLAYFDAYRAEAISEKAAMTIADVMSRETNGISDTYLDGVYGLLQFLTYSDANPEMRVSVLRYHDKTSLTPDGTDDHFHVVWSEVRNDESTGKQEKLQTSDAKTMTAKLPKMGNEDRLILVETWTHYDSAYNLGMRNVWGGNDGDGEIKDIVMQTYVFTAPRFGQTCFDNTPATVDDRIC